VTLRVFYLFFFANFDHTTIVNLVSDFTCFYLFFIIFEWAWTFVDLFCFVVEISLPNLGDDKTAVLMHFDVKNSNSTKWTYVVYDLDGSVVGTKKKSSFDPEQFNCAL